MGDTRRDSTTLILGMVHLVGRVVSGGNGSSYANLLLGEPWVYHENHSVYNLLSDRSVRFSVEYISSEL